MAKLEEAISCLLASQRGCLLASWSRCAKPSSNNFKTRVAVVASLGSYFNWKLPWASSVLQVLSL